MGSRLNFGASVGEREAAEGGQHCHPSIRGRQARLRLAGPNSSCPHLTVCSRYSMSCQSLQRRTWYWETTAPFWGLQPHLPNSQRRAAFVAMVGRIPLTATTSRIQSRFRTVKTFAFVTTAHCPGRTLLTPSLHNPCLCDLHKAVGDRLLAPAHDEATHQYPLDSHDQQA